MNRRTALLQQIASENPSNIAIVRNLGSENPSNVTFTIGTNFQAYIDSINNGDRDFTDENNNVFVEFLPVFRKVLKVVDNQIVDFAVSLVQYSGYIPYPCFLDADGSLLHYVRIGKYCMSSTTTANSVNDTPVRMFINTGRVLARNLGSGYQLYDWQIHKLYQDLSIIQKHTVNIKETQLLGINDINVSTSIDGIVCYSNNILFSYDPEKYVDRPTNSTTGYILSSYTIPYMSSQSNNALIKKLGYDSNHPFLNFPTEIENSNDYTKYFCAKYVYLRAYSNLGQVYFSLKTTDDQNGIYSFRANVDWGSEEWAKLQQRLCYRPLKEKVKRLPDEYQEVEYIESTGTQYIDSGVKLNQDSRFIVDYQYKANTTSARVFGNISSLPPNGLGLSTSAGTINSKVQAYYNQNNWTPSSQDSESFIPLTNRLVYERNANKQYINGNLYYTDDIVNFTMVSNATIFGFYYGDGNNNFLKASMLLYSLKIWNNNVLVRDFVPCYRILDNKPGLYDIVNDVFYVNQGTGTDFTLGPNHDTYVPTTVEIPYYGSTTLSSNWLNIILNTVPSENKSYINKIIVPTDYIDINVLWGYDFSNFPNATIYYGDSPVDYSVFTIRGSGTLTSDIVDSQVSLIGNDKITEVEKIVVPIDFTAYESGSITELQSFMNTNAIDKLVTTYEAGEMELSLSGDIVAKIVSIGKTLDEALVYAKNTAEPRWQNAKNGNGLFWGRSDLIIMPPCLKLLGTVQWTFKDCTNLVYVDKLKFEYLGQATFEGCDNLIKVKEINVKNSGSQVANIFGGYSDDYCKGLKYVYIKTPDLSTPPSGLRQYCLYIPKNVEKAILEGFNMQFYMQRNTVMTRDNMLILFNSLSVANTSLRTITLNATLLDKLTNADIQIAYDKNWKLSPTPSAFTFEIDGNSYSCDFGMTWTDWIASAYNTDGYYIQNNKVYTSERDIVQLNNTDVLDTDMIRYGDSFTILLQNLLLDANGNIIVDNNSDYIKTNN